MVRLTDRPDMTLDVYRGRKAIMQMQRGYNPRVSVSGFSPLQQASIYLFYIKLVSVDLSQYDIFRAKF